MPTAHPLGEKLCFASQRALEFARKAHSQQGVEEIKQMYVILSQLEPKNPYIANLGVELGIFPE